MITLGIETSCDETSCAVLRDGNKILSNVIASSLEKHKPYGGIVPEIASRHSLENIQFVFEQALLQAKVSFEDIQLIAVTRGPGLIGSLLVGISFAKALAYSRNIDLIGVSHLEAHLEANLIDHSIPNEPFVGLIVSGGHTLLVLHENGKYKRLGETVDDAAGEAYDKAAKLMGLEYPGGPILDRMAKEGDSARYRFTKPKLDGEMDFSFSGIKTAVLHKVEELKEKIPQEKFHLAASFQTSVVGWLIDGVRKACLKTGVKYVLVGGGVTANSLLRLRLKALEAELGVEVLIPPIALTLDNGAMIAKCGYDRFQMGMKSGFDLTAMPNLKIGD